jgi:hypothetical protein
VFYYVPDDVRLGVQYTSVLSVFAAGCVVILGVVNMLSSFALCVYKRRGIYVQTRTVVAARTAAGHTRKTSE